MIKLYVYERNVLYDTYEVNVTRKDGTVFTGYEACRYADLKIPADGVMTADYGSGPTPCKGRVPPGGVTFDNDTPGDYWHWGSCPGSRDLRRGIPDYL